MDQGLVGQVKVGSFIWGTMKILLIYPYFIEERVYGEDIRPVPMGVYSVAAVLKEHGYDAEILNWHDMKERPEEIKEILSRNDPDVIGFSILHGNRWGGIEIARIAKTLNPGVKIVFGGPGATFLWRHLLTHFSEIDIVVRGEGEYPFLDIIRAADRGQWEQIGEVKGIAFKRKGKIYRTEEREPIGDLDGLPIPARHFTYQFVSSTRGCAWRCRFCGSPAFWGGKTRYRSPDSFVKELEILCHKGVSFFYVSDDAFTMKKDRVIDICKRILERRLLISWYAISRVDCVDEDILYWMRKAGCVQISYGLESGSERIRSLLGKKIKTEDIARAFALTARYGILPRAYFIYGSPGETNSTIQETIDLMKEIKPLGAVFYILDVFPGTALYESLKKTKRVNDDLWLKKMEGIMYFETEPGTLDDLMLSYGKRLRTSFYENLPTFARSISLIDRKDLYEQHADFYSRLAMTFSHGDYAKMDEVREKDRVAEELYEKALQYSPDHRAYLGLGSLKQEKGEWERSVDLLSEGITHFPESEELNLCAGISYMNLGAYESALSIFRGFPRSERARAYAALCRERLEKAG